MTPLTRPAGPTPRRASATHGAALTFETLVDGQAAHDRLRMHDDTLLRVVAGIVRLTIDARRTGCAPATRSSSPPTSTHRLASAGGVARIVTGLRAVRR